MSEAKIKRSRGYKKKGGTHGSLSKAGKTRDMNKRTWDTTGKKSKKGHPFKHRKQHKCPRVANKQRFKNRIVLDRYGNKNVT